TFISDEPPSGLRHQPRLRRNQGARPQRRALAGRKSVAPEARLGRERALSISAKPRQAKDTVDQRFVTQMLSTYTPLVRQIAGGFQRRLPRNVLREDLIAAGMSGLWDAIRRHTDRPTESFEWYVRVRIRGAILDELRAQDWLPRRARAAAAEAVDQGATRAIAPAVVRFDDV